MQTLGLMEVRTVLVALLSHFHFELDSQMGGADEVGGRTGALVFGLSLSTSFDSQRWMRGSCLLECNVPLLLHLRKGH